MKTNSVLNDDKKQSLFSTSKKKMSVFSEQNNLTSELLKKICDLENINKKLKKKNQFLTRELDNAEDTYK